MRSIRRFRALIFVVLVFAGLATVSRHFGIRADSGRPASAAAASGAATAGDVSGGTAATTQVLPGTASAGTTGAGPAAAPGQGGGVAQQPNPLPAVTVPYEQEPEIDLSTHYAIIKGQRAHPYKLLAKYKTAAAAPARDEVLGELALRAHSQFPLTPNLVVIKPVSPSLALVTSAQEAQALGDELMKRAEALLRTGQFEYVEPDYIVTIDATPSDQSFTDGTLWGLRNTGQAGGIAGADIDATRAWNTTTGSTSVVVAVIDTGVRYTHQDLSAQMWRNPDEIAGNGIDDDQDGYVDNVYGINGITNSGNPMDDNNHGTHCAGTIGAQADGGGPIVGVAWSVKIMACKFLSASGSGSTSDAIKCINFAVLKGANIMSNSWGGGGASQALSDAITAANASGVLFVAAAGNNYSNNDLTPSYPASYAHSNVLSVAALDRQDLLAGFSNYGATSVDIGAPGVSIYSSTATSDTSYASFSGTSMATPHVSGVAALVLASNPDISVLELKQRILSGAVPVAALAGKCVTGARLNAFNALTGEPDGALEVTVVPGAGTQFTTGSTVPVFVHVRDFNAVTNATVTGTAGGSSSVSFVNNGTGSDAVANDNIYSGSITMPASGTTFELQIQVSAPGKTSASVDVSYSIRQAPANDQFASRITISGSETTVTGYNVGASREMGEPYHYTTNSAGKSVWWTWTAPSNGTVTFRTAGSSFDTVLGAYTGAAVNALSLRGSDDDSGGNLSSIVSFTATSGTAYHIAVDGYGAGNGDITLAVSFIAAPTPPANDNFASASALTGGAEASATGNNLLATKEAGEPNHAGNTGGRSAWWTWTAPSSGVATVTTDGSLFDTTLGVYTGTSVGALTVVASDNDSGEGSRSQASFAAVAGATYRIAVDGFNGTSGTIALALSLVTTPAIPANDAFASAATLTLSGSSVTASGTNIGATKETNEPSHAQNAGAHSVWWTWTAPSDGSVILNTTGSNFDTTLAVYTGTTLGGLTEIASNDQDPTQTAGARTSRVQFNVTSGSSYRIAVDGLNDGLNTALGSITLNLTLSTIILPTNDLFALRTSISSAAATIQASNNGATAETGEPAHYSTANRSVWWSWTAPASNQVVISVVGTNFIPVVAVYTGNNFSSLISLARAYGNGPSYTSNVNFAAIAGTTYHIAVDSLTSYSSVGTFTLNVNPPIPAPVITSQPAGQTRHPGDSIYLSVGTAYSPVPLTFQWRKNGVNLTNSNRLTGATSSYLSIASTQLDDAGSYTVAVTNAGGTTTSNSAAVAVTIPPAPVITSHPSNQSAYIGESIYLYVSSSYTGTTTYQWQRSTDGGTTFTSISGATYSSFSLYTSQASDFGSYRVIVTNPGGSTTSNAAVITPLTPLPPTFSTQPVGGTVQGGGSINLNAYATGRGNVTFRWQKNGVDVTPESGRVYGATSTYLTIYNATMADAGQYRLIATNVGGSVTSTAVTITVTAPPIPVIYSQPNAYAVIAGSYANFYVFASGVGLQYQWQRNGVNLVNDSRIGGATSYSLSISNTQMADAGQYRVIVSNDGGSVTSTAVALTVTLPAPPSFYSHPSSVSAREGDPFSLYGYASASGTITYQWYKDNVAVTGATSSSYSRTGALEADAGVYKLAATNAGGTVFSNNATVAIAAGIAPAFVVQPASTTVELGDRVSLNASAAGFPAPTYVWYKNGAVISGAAGTSLSVVAQSGDNGATYYARATNIKGSADSATATLTVLAAGSGRVLGLTPATRTVGAGRVVYPLTVRTKASWTASTPANWIALTPASGNGSRTLEVTVAPNPLPVERSATITIDGRVHTLTQRSSGTPVRELWTVGDNTLGQLGDGSLPPSAYPILAGSGFTSVAATLNHSMLLKADGTLWGTGLNTTGQLGDGMTITRRAPVQVMTGVRSVSVGLSHTLILKNDDTLWACGSNLYGQLGDGTTVSRISPVQVATAVQSVVAGDTHSLILKTDGTLLACGYNFYGQLGDGTVVNRAVPVQAATGVRSMAAGRFHSLFVKTDGTLWAMGNAIYAQLGNGPGSSPVSTPVQTATGVKAVSAGGYSTFIIKNDDSLWAFGYNVYGQLGVGSNTVAYTPVQVTTHVRAVATTLEHTLILKTDGTLLGCGENLMYELGDGTSLNRLSPVQIATGVSAIGAGDDHSLFVKTDGTLWGMGNNGRGQLGEASSSVDLRTTPVSVASDVQSVSAGQDHTFFITSNGMAWSTGGNYFGQLADGGDISRTVPVVVFGSAASVSAGARHSLLLKDNGDLFTAGCNDNAQLGDGTSLNRATPMRIASSVESISAGGGHSLLRKANSFLGFGSNSYGQLSDGYSYSRPTPVIIFGASVLAIAAGENHSLLVKADNSLWVTGHNSSGQLGLGHQSSVFALSAVAGSYRTVAAGLSHSVVLKTDGSAWAMGLNSRGQLGDASYTSRVSAVQVSTGVRAVAAGRYHSFLLKDDNSLWAFGDNASGQLGTNGAAVANTPQRVALNVASVSAGAGHSVFIATGDPRAGTYTAPAVTNFTPTTPAAGATVTINGSGFSNVLGVYFNHVAATSFTVVSANQITAVAPAIDLANLTVTIGTFDGVAARDAASIATPPPAAPPAAGGAAGGGGGGAPSLWMLGALALLAVARWRSRR